MLRLTVEGSDPVIDRTVIVPAHASFYDLHMVIQDAMLWDNAHLYSFDADGDIIEEPESGAPVDVDALLPLCIPISEYEGCPVDYNYDFGDDWHISIEWVDTVEDRQDGCAELVSWNGDSPPEDCGGIRAYNENRGSMDVPAFDEKDARDTFRMWRIQGIAGIDTEFAPEFIRVEMDAAALSMMESEIVYDTYGFSLAAVSRIKRRSKRRGPEEVPTVSREDVDREPERYIPVWNTAASCVEGIFREFLEVQGIGSVRKEGESAKEFIQRTEGSMDEETLSDWRDFCLQRLSMMVCDWAEEHGIMFYDPPGSAVGAAEKVLRSLRDSDIAIDDPEALMRFMDDYNASRGR